MLETKVNKKLRRKYDLFSLRQYGLCEGLRGKTIVVNILKLFIPELKFQYSKNYEMK